MKKQREEMNEKNRKMPEKRGGEVTHRVQ